MIFCGQQERRAGSPLVLATFPRDALYPYKCRTMLIHERNFAPQAYVESLPVKVQVELESPFTGCRVTLAGATLPLGHTFPISQFWKMCGEPVDDASWKKT